jgi:hypothetical protein
VRLLQAKTDALFFHLYNHYAMTAEELLARYEAGERDFTGVDLSGVNLNGANLSGINLGYANLSRASLFEANLSGANLQYANLSDVNLMKANLENAKLENVIQGKSSSKVVRGTLSRVIHPANNPARIQSSGKGTGKRINQSSDDDAARLAFSEKMKAQIRQLDKSAQETQDEISPGND